MVGGVGLFDYLGSGSEARVYYLAAVLIYSDGRCYLVSSVVVTETLIGGLDRYRGFVELEDDFEGFEVVLVEVGTIENTLGVGWVFGHVLTVLAVLLVFNVF